MRETLYIRLIAGAAERPLAYALSAADGDARGGAGRSNLLVQHAPLAEIAGYAAGRVTVVFVPAGDIRLSRVPIPARQPSKALQAVPYLLEDQFADDVDVLHFALGARQADGSYPVAAVAKKRIEQWLETLNAAGIQPQALIPEPLALGWQAGSWQALAEGGDQVTVRTGLCSGFRCGVQDLAFMLNLADAGAETPTALRVQLTTGASSDFSALERPVALLPGFSDALQVFARDYQPESSINLLQGALSARNDWDRHRAAWRLPINLALAAGLTALALVGAQAFQLNRSAAKLEAANLERFAQVFPNETANPLIMQQQVDSLIRRAEGGGANAGPFALMQSLAEAQAATPGLAVHSIQFRDGALFVDMTGGDLQILEKLRGWFAGHAGTKLEVQTADSGAEGVRIRLKLSPA